MSKKSVKSIVANHLNLKNATVTRALPKWCKLHADDGHYSVLQDYDKDYGFECMRDLLTDRNAGDIKTNGYTDGYVLFGQDIRKCLKPGMYYEIPDDAEFGIKWDRRSEGFWFYTNCPYVEKLWNEERFVEEFYKDRDECIIADICEKAKGFAEDAKCVKEECEKLYDEVKDFIADYDGDLWDSDDEYAFHLKDGCTLSYNTAMTFFYHDGDEVVEISDEEGCKSYRDDFVEKYTDDLFEQWNEIEAECDLDDEINDAGELYCYSLLKTALTVAKERMAKWDGIDHTDDDDECVECAE